MPEEQAIKKVPVGGGDAFTVCRTSEDKELLYGLDWGENDRIVFATGATDGIQEVKASGAGGVASALTKPEEPHRFHRWPEYLPDGRGVLFSADQRDGPFNNADIMVLRASDAVVMPLGVQGHHAHYLPSGHLVYVRGHNVFGVRFDLERLEIRGEERALLKGLSQIWGLVAWSFARNGDLVYKPKHFESRRVALEWVDRDGNRSPALPLGTYDWFKISPDGDWLIYGDEIGRIRIVNLETRVSKTIRGEPQGVFPVWGPKGEWVMWAGVAGEGLTNIHEAHTSLYLNRLGDGAEAERLVPGDQLQIPVSWSRDGRHALFFSTTEETGGDVLVFDLERTTEMTWRAGDISEFQVRPGYQDYAQFSPDGKWVAFISAELGTMNLWVSRFDSPEETKKRVAELDVLETFPNWLGADELLYLKREFDPQPPLHRIQRVSYAIDRDEFRWEHLEPWPDATTVNHFAADPDGTRVLVQKPEELVDPNRFNRQVVLFANFAQYVKEQIGEGDE